MGTLTGNIMVKQHKLDWFSQLSEEKRNEYLSKYLPEKTLGVDVLNEHIYFIYDKEHNEICEGCENIFDIKDMKMDSEEGFWVCKSCLNQE